MDWEQMIVAMRAAGGEDVNPYFHKPGKWICRLPGYIEGDGMRISTFGSGATAREAVEDAWAMIAHLPEDRYLNVRGRFLRWNGFMFLEVTP